MHSLQSQSKADLTTDECTDYRRPKGLGIHIHVKVVTDDPPVQDAALHSKQKLNQSSRIRGVSNVPRSCAKVIKVCNSSR